MHLFCGLSRLIGVVERPAKALNGVDQNEINRRREDNVRDQK